MAEGIRDTTTKNITILFIILTILQPFSVSYYSAYISWCQCRRNPETAADILPIIAFFSVIFFIRKNRYLDKIIDFLQSGREFEQAEMAASVRKYPLESMIILFSGCMAAPFIAVLSGLKSGIIISAQQGIFFFMMGAVLACIAGAVFF
jgi:hypothetical protein